MVGAASKIAVSAKVSVVLLVSVDSWKICVSGATALPESEPTQAAPV